MHLYRSFFKSRSILPVILAVCLLSFTVCRAQQRPRAQKTSKHAITFNYPCDSNTITIDLGTRKKAGYYNSFDLVLKCTNNTRHPASFPKSLTVWNDTDLRNERHELFIVAQPRETVEIPLHFHMYQRERMNKGGRMDVVFKDSTITYNFKLKAVFVD